MSSVIPSPTLDLGDVDEPVPPRVYTAGDFIIGLLITLGASVLNAAGLNLTKLDHVRNLALPRAERRPDWMRALWSVTLSFYTDYSRWLGLTLYILSQLIGSTLALEYLRAEYVAPLGASSLIFNFLFAHFLVGTKITRRDILGTSVVVIGVIGVVAFGNARKKIYEDVDDGSEGKKVLVGDTEMNMNLDTLKNLWGNVSWWFYFIFYSIVVLVLVWLSTVLDDVVKEREELESSESRARTAADEQERLFDVAAEETFERQHDPPPVGTPTIQEQVSEGYSPRAIYQRTRRRERRLRKFARGYIERATISRPDSVVRKLAGIAWSVSGGLLAGLTLIFAKSIVKLASTSLSHSSSQSQFSHPLSIFILLLLAVVAITQVVCLNKGLRAYDSVLIVPLFFALYSASGFVNSLTYVHGYLDEMELYSKGIFACIWISIVVLIAGVVILSSKPPDRSAQEPKVDVEGGEQQTSALDSFHHDGEGTSGTRPSRSGTVGNKVDDSKQAENETYELSSFNTPTSDVQTENNDSFIVKEIGTESQDGKKASSEETENWTLGEGTDDEEEELHKGK